MVGGLVQHQQVRLGQQQARQAKPGLFAAGEQAGGLGLPAPGEAQARQHALYAAGPLVAPGVLEAVHQAGIGLRQLIKGKLTAFTGNSGVGKSSMLNALCPQLRLPTGEVSEKLGRGRHTTRHVELYNLGDDTFVADTPGFSSFDTDQMDVMLKENLQYAFQDFGSHIGNCQFHDCTHRKEPGCAIRAAVDKGALEPTRYDSYLKLYEKASQIKQWELK